MPDSTIKQQTFSFLKGGGEMGRLMRNKDWSESTVGTPDSWPQSLRTTLGIILNSKFPMFLWWGSELICFYNDAYRPSLGENGKHPFILGMPAKDAWPEIWDIIKPLIDQVLAGGEATWMEDQLIPIFRNGKIEDVYWTFSYSPVNNESGYVSGVLVTCTETTENVMIRHKLEESKNKLEFAIEAARLGTWEYNPANNKFISNDRLKEWFGLSHEAEIDLQHATDAIAEKDRQRVIELIQKALDPASGGQYDVEYTIIHPIIKKETIVHAKGKAWFNEENIAYRFNGTLEDVTEEVTARKKVEQSEEKFRSMVVNSPVAKAILRGQDHIIDVANKTILENLWRKTESEVVGKKIIDVFPELRYQKNLEFLDEVFTSGEPHTEKEFKLHLHDANGPTQFYVDFKYSPLREIDGNISGVMITANDVTAQVEARHIIEENEKRLNIVIEASGLGIWELDLKTNEVNYSDRYLEILGYKGKVSLTHEQLLRHLHPKDLHLREKAFKEALVSGVLHYETRIIWLDNSIHWLEGMGKVFYDDQNKPLRMIGTIRDITDEKNYQQELQQREQRFRLLANSMPQHIWTSDIEGNSTYVSDSLCNYTGLTSTDFKNDWSQIVHPDDQERNMSEWTKAVSAKQIFLAENRLRRYDGEYKWHLSRAVPQLDNNGSVQMWVGTSTDIHDIKQNEQLKDDFIKMASHELKTPVTTIRGYVQLLMEMYKNGNDPILANSLSSVDKHISKLTKLITDLLDVTKIETGSLHLAKENFKINKLIEEIIKDIQITTSTHWIIFKPDTDASVFADRDRISQVLINLLINAIKYSPQAKEVIIKTRLTKEEIVVSIQDFGIGIDVDDHEKIFERFYRVQGKNEKTYPGFGIGLFIVKEIISNHQGKIWVESEKGKGSIFYFGLPAIAY